MLNSLFWIVIIYIVGAIANTGYRVLRHGESISEAIAPASRWPVGAYQYLYGKVAEWYVSRF